jgi:RNA polymerase sigma factor (TIGR02999 family)
MSLHPNKAENLAELANGASGKFPEVGRRYNQLERMQASAMPGEPDRNDISRFLRAWSEGDQSALNGLTPIVYEELRRMAHHYMEREGSGHTFQTTVLVNEAYMRLVDYKRMQWRDRAHFFAVAAQVMRRILVDHARTHNIKRGAGFQHVVLDDVAVVNGDRTGDLVALDDATNALARLDPRKVQIIEMRFFGGLSVEETAEVLKVSPATVRRDWSIAKFWLCRELGGGTGDGFGTVETNR